MKRTAVIFVLAGLVMAACSGKSGSGSGFDRPGGGGADGGGSDGGFGAVGNNGDGGPSFGNQTDSSTPGSCQFNDGTDHDGDGFSGTDGDCNDCDPNTNPGAFDVPMDGIDEDCDGIPDDEPTGCDATVALASTDAFDGAKAIDLCRKTTATAQGKSRTWGVISAKFVAPDATDNCGGSCVANPSFQLGHGNLTKLGVNKTQQGKHMLGISSGTARDPSDTGYQDVGGFDKGYTTGFAAGFPAPSPACMIPTGQAHDGVGLELTIRVPTNAKSFTVNENFFTYEFPDYICSPYNDGFAILMSPKIGNQPNNNIAYDQQGNPISVNNSLLQVCDAQTAGGKSFPCPSGSSTLAATGFGTDTAGQNHAATGWLQTKAPVDTLRGKEITLLFAVWDSSDGVLDSSTLIDNFQWSLDPATSGPVTVPNPPK